MFNKVDQHNIEELIKLVEHPKNDDDLCAVLHEMFDKKLSEEEMCEILEHLHLPEEKQELELEEETLSRK